MLNEEEGLYFIFSQTLFVLSLSLCYRCSLFCLPCLGGPCELGTFWGLLLWPQKDVYTRDPNNPPKKMMLPNNQFHMRESKERSGNIFSSANKRHMKVSCRASRCHINVRRHHEAPWLPLTST